MDVAGRFKMTIAIISYELHEFVAWAAEELNMTTSKHKIAVEKGCNLW